LKKILAKFFGVSVNSCTQNGALKTVEYFLIFFIKLGNYAVGQVDVQEDVKA
jgi:hypothetical protein